MRATAWLATVLVGVCASQARAQDFGPAGQTASTPDPSLAPPYIGPELSGSVLAVVSSSADYDEKQYLDSAYGLGLWYAPVARFAVGARYEYMGLGGGESSTGTDYVDANYSAHTGWLTGRAYPFLGDAYSIFVGAGVGMVLMRQSAVGIRTTDITDPAGDPFKCGGTSSPNVGFRASTGLDLAIGERLAFVTSADATMLRGSSDIENDCVPGVGSPISVGVGIGFAYHFAL
ncbi:MAG TPA: hypothetical protein VI197_20560 [Polyangiaceae bacterium]